LHPEDHEADRAGAGDYFPEGDGGRVPGKHGFQEQVRAGDESDASQDSQWEGKRPSLITLIFSYSVVRDCLIIAHIQLECRVVNMRSDTARMEETCFIDET
jgi:hypothetical protein